MKHRITCSKNPNGVRPGIFFANVWGPDPEHGNRLVKQLGHGEGTTRREAIANATKQSGRRTMTTRRERLEAKVEKRGEWAAKAACRSEARFGAASAIADRIPFGQPVLIGHHSEGKHRRDAARIHANMDKGVEEHKLAEHHAQKAAGLAAQLAKNIFDDDPDAIEQLEARIVARTESAEHTAKINKAWRKGGAALCLELGLVDEKTAAEFARTMALCGWMKSPCSTTGTRAAIRSDRERIGAIKAKRARAEKAEAAPSGVLVEGANWVRVTFPRKPERDVLIALRMGGFQFRGGSWHGERAKLPLSIQVAEVQP